MAANLWLLASLTVGHVLFPGALAECTWKEVKGTSIPGGNGIFDFSLSECQSACLQRDGCQSIDYEKGTCTLHTTQDGQQPTPDSSHFDYICEAEVVTKPNESQDGCTLTKVTNPAVPEGILIPPAVTIEACRDACSRTPGCRNFDWIDSFHLCYLPVQPSVDRYELTCAVGTTTEPPIGTTTEPPTTTTIRPQPTTTTPPATTTTTTPVCKTKLDLVFVVDGSTSICRMPITTCDNWKFNLQFIHKIVDDQTIGPDDTRVGLVMFSDGAYVEFNLNKYTDKASLLSVIDNLRYPLGQTNTTGALKTLVSAFTPAAGDRPDVPNVSILITDGNPTRDVAELPAAIDLVQTSGIYVLVVGVSKYVNEDVVRNISSNPQEVNKTYFMAKDYSSIDLVRIELLDQTCSLGG